MSVKRIESNGCQWEITVQGEALKVRLVETPSGSLGVYTHQPAGNVVVVRPDEPTLDADMLEALQDELDLIAGDATGAEWKANCRAFLAKALDVIAKAEGRG